MPRPKDILTTGEVAAICKVAPRTVSKWFDSGRLRGYRIPGSKDRRIPVDQLIRFMKAHDIPLNGLESGATRVLIVESDGDMAELLSNVLAKQGAYDVQVARTAFEAGATAELFRPHVMLLDVSVPGLAGRETIRSIRALRDMDQARLIAVTQNGRDGESEALRQDGFDGYLAKPFEVSQVVNTIDSALNSVSGTTSITCTGR